MECELAINLAILYTLFSFPSPPLPSLPLLFLGYFKLVSEETLESESDNLSEGEGGRAAAGGKQQHREESSNHQRYMCMEV